MARSTSFNLTARTLLALIALAAPAAAQQSTLPQMHPQNTPQPAAKKSWLGKLPWGKGGNAAPRQAPPSEPEGRQISPQQKRQGQYSMARLAERRDQTDAAIKIYEALTRKYPSMAGPYHRLGVIAAKQGQAQRAAQMMLRAHQMNPKDPEVLRDLGYLYYVNGRLDEAETAYRRGLGIKPDHVAITNNYAMLLTERQRYEDAFKLFQNVNEPAEAHANMGFMLVQMGYLEKGEKYLSHALTLDSSLESAAHALMQVAELKKKAESMKQLAEAQQKGGQAQAATQPKPIEPTPQPAAGATVAQARIGDRSGVAQASLSDDKTPAANRIATQSQAMRNSKAVKKVSSDAHEPARAKATPAVRLESRSSSVPSSKGRQAVGVVDKPAAAQPGPARKRNTLRIRSSRQEPAAKPQIKQRPVTPVKPDAASSAKPAESTAFAVPGKLDLGSGTVGSGTVGIGDGSIGNLKWSTNRFPTSRPTWTPDSKKPAPAAVAP